MKRTLERIKGIMNCSRTSDLSVEMTRGLSWCIVNPFSPEKSMEVVEKRWQGNQDELVVVTSLLKNLASSCS